MIMHNTRNKPFLKFWDSHPKLWLFTSWFCIVFVCALGAICVQWFFENNPHANNFCVFAISTISIALLCRHNITWWEYARLVSDVEDSNSNADDYCPRMGTRYTMTIPEVPAVPAVPEVIGVPAVPAVPARPAVGQFGAPGYIPRIPGRPAIPAVIAVPAVPEIPAIPAHEGPVIDVEPQIEGDDLCLPFIPKGANIVQFIPRFKDLGSFVKRSIWHVREKMCGIPQDSRANKMIADRHFTSFCKAYIGLRTTDKNTARVLFERYFFVPTNEDLITAELLSNPWMRARMDCVHKSGDKQ